ncbi:hypothetical protein GQ457_08G035700 [Hibiscus cannabinus]
MIWGKPKKFKNDRTLTPKCRISRSACGYISITPYSPFSSSVFVQTSNCSYVHPKEGRFSFSLNQSGNAMKLEKETRNLLHSAVQRRRKLRATMNHLMMVGHSKEGGETTSALMDNLMGLLRVHVKRGTNLAVRDVRSSDPYVTVKMGHQRLKTRIVKKDVNPEWNDDLTLSITDPNIPVKLTVYDHDTFTKNDKMGNAEFDVRPFIEALKMHANLEEITSGSVLSRVQPSATNCLAKESAIYVKEGKIMQDLILRLQKVECGEVEIQLEWIHFPGSKTFLSQ